MRFARLLLAAVCLLGFAAVSQAAEEAVPAPDAGLAFETPSPIASAEPLEIPAGGCEAAATPAIGDLGGLDPIPQVIPCGSCSSSNCVGATRGQICHLGSGQGWGNCNIYSGGFMCSTGGWECQCGSGPLP